MRLQTKFYLGIIVIFAALAVVIALLSINYLNTRIIHEAENRVSIYARAAWEIHNSQPELLRSALEVLAQRQSIRELLRNPGDEEMRIAVQEELEALRKEHNIDILNLVAPDGTVILRTRVPYARGDNLATDPLIKQSILTNRSVAGNAILGSERLGLEGSGLIERSLAFSQEPRDMFAGAAVPVLESGELIGILEMGDLLAGSVEEVDRIRDAVFANESYNGKPVGTATVFLDDLRISTNVMDDQDRRAVGTRASKEVADHVLGQGLSWTGRAFVVDTWYLSQYDPIRDPDGHIIGMLYVGELEQKYLDQGARAAILYLSVVIGGMLLAFIMVFLVTRGILGPIRRLSEATRRISSGDLTYRVPVHSRDELGDLSISFNQMAEQLEAQRQEIVRGQKELEALNDELRGINRNYMEMLGFVAHELRNPLTSAIMSLYTVKDGYLGELSAAQKRSLESTAQSLDYFQDMIKNYLDLSRLEKGEYEVNKTDFSLNVRVVRPVLEALQPELEQQRMVVVNQISEGMIVHADANLLRIIYNNLLSNAVKYGREGGRIVLRAQEAAGKVTLSVRNDSEGIPPDMMSSLFRKFSRLDTSVYASKRGTGLGLYICKELLEKQGGEIWADSRVGEWAEFSFTLPKPEQD